jgi:hypothetical protein
LSRPCAVSHAQHREWAPSADSHPARRLAFATTILKFLECEVSSGRAAEVRTVPADAAGLGGALASLEGEAARGAGRAASSCA